MGNEHFWFLFFVVLKDLRWPGVECVCTRACVCFASGNREQGKRETDGPPELPLGLENERRRKS